MAAIRASGKQKIGTLVTSISYCVIGIPLASLLCFKFDAGIKGIWAGPTIAVAITTCAYMLIFKCMDWDSLIAEAILKRTQDDKFKMEKEGKETTDKVNDEENEDEFKKI